MHRLIHLVLASAALLLMSCEGFFGDRTDTSFLNEPTYDDRTLAYVPVLPIWQGLVYPTDVIAGFDELIYVADSGQSQIISYDQSGRELGRFEIPGLSAIAQDRRLDLLATGTAQRVISGDTLTLAAIYRLDLNPAGEYGLQHAVIDTVIVHPNYFRSGEPVPSNQLVRFTGIAIQGDNQYYVSRIGPSNNPNQFGGPDNSVHLFNAEDDWVQNLLVSTSLGQVSDYFKTPVALGGLITPPQLEPGDRRLITVSSDFLFCSNAPDAPLKVQYIRLNRGDGTARAVYEQQLFTPDFSTSDDYLYRPDRFRQPTDVSVAGDRTGFIFVVDAALDSLYQFSPNGLEGQEPPPGSNAERYIITSFGGAGAGPTQFNDPRGVAYLRGTVYVADAGNGRILRFQLTTEFDQ
jgi:hypothetical protein